jgi:hypothetical protein
MDRMAHAVGFTVALMPQAVPTTWSNSEEAIGTSRQFTTGAPVWSLSDVERISRKLTAPPSSTALAFARLAQKWPDALVVTSPPSSGLPAAESA